MKKLIATLMLTVTPLGACGSGVAEPTTTEAASVELSASTRTDVLAALGAYERIRAALANDTLDGVAAAGQEIVARSKTAAASAPSALRPAIEAIGAQAQTLAGATDVEGARLAFGELSRVVVALAAKDPDFTEGRHVFSCPMAEGYQQWVQTSEALENPYMGQQMLACGGAGDWSK